MDADITRRAKEFAAGDPFPINGFSHLEWWVGNAHQTAQFFRAMLGFSIIGYRGPETGKRDTSSYLLESGGIRFIVTAAQRSEHPVSDHVHLHGPGVHDVALAVPDATGAFELAMERGAGGGLQADRDREGTHVCGGHQGLWRHDPFARRVRRHLPGLRAA